LVTKLSFQKKQFKEIEECQTEHKYQSVVAMTQEDAIKLNNEDYIFTLQVINY